MSQDEVFRESLESGPERNGAVRESEATEERAEVRNSLRRDADTNQDSNDDYVDEGIQTGDLGSESNVVMEEDPFGRESQKEERNGGEVNGMGESTMPPWLADVSRRRPTLLY